jgi:hypothetical protein
VTAIPAAVVAAMHDGVARLDEHGHVTPANAAMQAVCAAAGAAGGGAWSQLGGDAASLAALRAGEPVPLAVGVRTFLARAVRDDDVTWLLLHETTDAARATSAAVELLRLRALGSAAGGLVHDFNNLLNAALGVASVVGPLVQDARDQQVLRELSVGTQQGAQLARALARMLMKPGGGHAPVALATIVDEAMALAAKVAAQRGVPLARGDAPDAVRVRAPATEAVQALWHGLLALCEARPARIAITTCRHVQPLGPARQRTWGRICLAAAGLPAGATADLVALVDGGAERFAAMARAPQAASLAAAVFVARRCGGDLRASFADGVVTLDYDWPAAG